MESFSESFKSKFYRGIDWPIFLVVLPLLGAGLVTMNSFLPAQAGVGQSPFFEKQLIWIGLGFLVFFTASLVDWRFLRRTWVSVLLFVLSALLLLALFVTGQATKGAVSWFDFGAFSLQPSDPIKIFLIIILAKYFSRRHVEIANFRHILVSAFYAGVLFLLVLLQPDFGSAIIILMIWLGMVLVSGISKKHLLLVILTGILALVLLWSFVFAPYQKDRILTFLNPLTDTTGAGYNALQSTIAIGSGEIFGKGLGYGTQSRLKFLPEYETDFIFAAFSEEWGFIGVMIIFILFGILFWRVLLNSMHGATNFEILFGLGVAIFLMSHFIVHVGMNIGLLPVTGTTVPFLSYGGSHLFTEFLALGILMGMRRYGKAYHKDDTKNEFLGIEKSV